MKTSLTIKTRYIGPTERAGARIHAKCQLGEASLPFNHSVSMMERHEQAFNALVEKLRARYGKPLQFNHEIV